MQTVPKPGFLELYLLRKKHTLDCRSLALTLAYARTFPGKLYFFRYTGLSHGEIKTIDPNGEAELIYLELAAGEFTAPTFRWVPNKFSRLNPFDHQELYFKVGGIVKVTIIFPVDPKGVYLYQEAAQLLQDIWNIFYHKHSRQERWRRIFSVEGTDSLIKHLSEQRRSVVILRELEESTLPLKYTLHFD